MAGYKRWGPHKPTGGLGFFPTEEEPMSDKQPKLASLEALKAINEWQTGDDSMTLGQLLDAFAAECVREARLEEAKWWINHLQGHGDEILQSDLARIAQLEREK